MKIKLREHSKEVLSASGDSVVIAAWRPCLTRCYKWRRRSDLLPGESE